MFCTRLRLAGYPSREVNACRHVHAYERHNRVFNYTLDDCAPYHVTIGMPQEHSRRKPSMPRPCCILLSLFHVVLLACFALARKTCCHCWFEFLTAMEVPTAQTCQACAGPSADVRLWRS